MKKTPKGNRAQQTNSMVQRTDVFVLLIIIIMMMLAYQWFSVYHQLRYEQQVNEKLKQMKMELTGRLAVQRSKFNHRITTLEQVAIDKKFVRNWGEYFTQMEQYETRRSRRIALNSTSDGAVGGDETVELIK